MTTYFVSGFMRSGTSMMMLALREGGMDVVFDPEREKILKQYGDEHYSPNRGGIFELTRAQYQQHHFPRDYLGKTIKCLYGGITKISALDDFKVVFMRRHPEEIRQSYQAFFGTDLKFKEEEITSRLEHALGVLEQRKDVEVFQIQYRNVVEDPLATFRYLVGSGWPLVPEKAASVVNPELCRFRLEDLTYGI